jgi:glucan phosphoethanolaminetransferase (alkaline phosphatase superfamily)
MMPSGDASWLILVAFLCVLAYARLFKYRRDDILHNPADELGAHLIALGVTMVFTVLSAEYGWMELAAFGFGLLVVVFIYYVFAYSGEGERE